MIRNKFIKNLRKKYQTGGDYTRGSLRDPYLTFQGRTINTNTGTRYGAGAKLSAPLLESVRYGQDTSGLRFETDFAGTNAGPISISDREKAFNASLGLRAYHNRYLNRNKTLTLNSNLGVGIGTGDEGDGGSTQVNPYGDINLSLLQSGRSNRNLAVGPSLSYGTESSPTPGLKLGVAGKAGRFSGNLGYDVTNNAVRAGVGYNFQTGGVKYNAIDKFQDGLTLAGMAPKLGIIPDAINTGISGIRAAYNYATGDTARADSQILDMGKNALSMVPAYGQTVAATKLGDRGLKVIKGIDKAKKVKKADAAYNLASAGIDNISGQVDRYPSRGPIKTTSPYKNINNSKAEQILFGRQLNQTPSEQIIFGKQKAQTGGMYEQPQMYKKGGEDDNTMPEKLKMRSLLNKKGQQYYREGGVALPGGRMQAIPGSDAVEFKGASHENGGIMVDSQTEVEGGETMDKVNMAKKGGKRDYFFSSFLKKGGRSFADMHKDILRKGGDQTEINMLAKMQEVAAGRNPKKVARLGGVVEYKHGGIHKYETGGAQKKYDEHESNKPTFNLTPPKPPRKLRTNANKIQEKQHRLKIEKYEKQLAEFNNAKSEYESKLSEWQTIENQLGDDLEQEQMLQEAEEREAQEAKEVEERENAKKAEEERIKTEELKTRNDALVQEAKDLGIQLPKSIKPSELQALIDSVKKDSSLKNVRKGEESFLPGTEGIPENQPALEIGGKKYFLDDPQLQQYMQDQGENFDQTWMSNVDPEVLKSAGITDFGDLQNKDSVLAYQKAYNAKYPDRKIKEDGLLGEETLNTGMPKQIQNIITEEIPVIDKATTSRLDAIPPQLLPVDKTPPELIQAEMPPQQDYVIRDDEEVLSIPMMQPSLLPVDNTLPGPIKAELPPYLGYEGIDEEIPDEEIPEKRTGIPTEAYLGMAAGLLPAAYAFFHKQPAAEQAGYTQGFRSPVIAQRGKAPKLERYDYNQDIANVGSEVRGMNKYIETSGGGPANMVNKMMAFSKGNDAKMKIRAAETRANIGVQNTEAQLEQQMNLDNMRRAQSASIFNAQMSRAETARMDQVDEANTQRRQKRIDDMEYMKYSGISTAGTLLQQSFGDILDYKADMARSAAIGTASGNVARDAQLITAGYTYDTATGQWTKGDKVVNKFGGVKRLLKYKK